VEEKERDQRSVKDSVQLTEAFPASVISCRIRMDIWTPIPAESDTEYTSNGRNEQLRSGRCWNGVLWRCMLMITER
jgi:predicted alternative tryptophan synthase beta-subunit